MKIICILIGYLFGSILTAEIVTRIKGVNVREIDPEAKHRGNPGFANVAINLGIKYGIFVLIGDALKGIIAFAIAYYLYGSLTAIIFTGFGLLLGHDFSFLYKFNGGKGVLVTIVWLIAIMPIYSWIVIVLSGVVVLVTGHLNTGSFAIPIIATPLCFIRLGLEAATIMFVVAVITYFRNQKDLQGISKGEFNKFSWFKLAKETNSKK